jgi:hypothetical protein
MDAILEYQGRTPGFPRYERTLGEYQGCTPGYPRYGRTLRISGLYSWLPKVWTHSLNSRVVLLATQCMDALLEYQGCTPGYPRYGRTVRISGLYSWHGYPRYGRTLMVNVFLITVNFMKIISSLTIKLQIINKLRRKAQVWFCIHEYKISNSQTQKKTFLQFC